MRFLNVLFRQSEKEIGNFVNDDRYLVTRLVERRDQGLLNTLEGLHRSEGAKAGWILLADSFAGAMILLSLTGVLLWTELNRRKTIGATIFIVSIGAALVLALQSV